MNDVYFRTSVVLFLAVPPSILAFRLVNPKRMPWWLVATLVALLGWTLSNVAMRFYYRYLYDSITAAGGIGTASRQLVDAWQNDGAKRAFAYIFGWLYGLVYLLPWLVPYFLADKYIARRRARAA